MQTAPPPRSLSPPHDNPQPLSMDTNSGTNMTDFGLAQNDNDASVAPTVDNSTFYCACLTVIAHYASRDEFSNLFGLDPSADPGSSADAQGYGNLVNPGHDEYQEGGRGRTHYGRPTNCASHGLCGRRDCRNHRGQGGHDDHHGHDGQSKEHRQHVQHEEHEQPEHHGLAGSDGDGANLVLHVRPVNGNPGAHEAYGAYGIQEPYNAYGPHMIGAQYVNHASIAIGIPDANNSGYAVNGGGNLSTSPPSNRNSPTSDIMEDSHHVKPANPAAFDYWLVANDRSFIGTAEYLYGNCQAGYGESSFHVDQ